MEEKSCGACEKEEGWSFTNGTAELPCYFESNHHPGLSPSSKARFCKPQTIARQKEKLWAWPTYPFVKPFRTKKMEKKMRSANLEF
ncbi:hypothetical protein CRE_29103 [Caenorhabditis remanei]|uniref:Uncharacterized protein n=1 Tax=Caenorhabditis remanei TaxID=31234 RepID=E3N4J0_CAERE|nr:hypothetical protein CRE_29103 [Caenorhabditis remanei]